MEIPTLSEEEKGEMMREMFVLNKQIAEKGRLSNDCNPSHKKGNVAHNQRRISKRLHRGLFQAKS